jgi:hypothetical protein
MNCENDNIVRRKRNLESTILIWLTTKSDESKLDRLRDIIDYIQVLDNVNACDKYIEQVVGDD